MAEEKLTALEELNTALKNANADNESFEIIKSLTDTAITHLGELGKKTTAAESSFSSIISKNSDKVTENLNKLIKQTEAAKAYLKAIEESYKTKSDLEIFSNLIDATYTHEKLHDLIGGKDATVKELGTKIIAGVMDIKNEINQLKGDESIVEKGLHEYLRSVKDLAEKVLKDIDGLVDKMPPALLTSKEGPQKTALLTRLKELKKKL